MSVREHETQTLIEKAVASDQPLILSKETIEILTSTLGIKSIEEVRDMPFPSSAIIDQEAELAKAKRIPELPDLP